MRPIPRILTVVIGAGIICQVVFMVFFRGYERFYYHTTRNLKELFEGKTAHDILFLGSSRTKMIIYPAPIDSICHTDSYNGGADNAKLIEFKMIFDGYLLSHPPPKMVVLSLDMHSFEYSPAFGNHVQYYPFVKNDAVSKALSSNGHSVFLKKIFPFLFVTELDDYTRGNGIKGLVSHGLTEVSANTIDYKGCLSYPYRRLKLSAYDTLAERKTVAISDTSLACLTGIIQICNEKNIKLIFTYAPEYEFIWQQKHVANHAQIFDQIYRLAGKNNIPYLRHDSLDICHDPDLFIDVLHLNSRGAKIYSAMLAHDLCDAR